MKRPAELEYISVAETKAKLSEKLRSIESRGRRFAITSHGRPKAVIIGYKEYLSFSEKTSPSAPKDISLDKWQKKAKNRKKIVESVVSLFDSSNLSRKGQKRYKRNVVRKMEKTK